MLRDAQVHPSDIFESCDAIVPAVHGLDVDGYRSNRLVRFSVEREPTIIGEAMATLARTAPVVFAAITQARQRSAHLGGRLARRPGDALPRLAARHARIDPGGDGDARRSA